MSMPFQPIPCTRCEQPVQPDPQAHGMWVDRWNGRHCGGDQRFPHQAIGFPYQPIGTGAPFPAPPAAPSAPAKSTTAAWVVGGSVLVVIVLVVAVAARVFLLQPGSGEPTAAGTSERTPHPTPSAQTASGQAEAEPTESHPAPPMPTASGQVEAVPTESGQAAPVPCDPQKPSGDRCFPPTIKGAEFLERLREAENWTCYRQGEKNRAGRKVRNPECETVTSDNQSYRLTTSIWYENHRQQQDRPMQKVVINVSTVGVNDGVPMQETLALAPRAFDIALTHLWPDDERLRTEAKEAFEKVHAVCAEIIDAKPVRMSSGYVVSCFPPITTPTADREGTLVTVRSYSVDIRAPYSHEMPYTG